MTAEHSSDDIAKNMLAKLESVTIDPIFLGTLVRVADGQKELDGIDEPTWHDTGLFMEPLNDDWDMTGWPGKNVTYTGKLHLINEYMKQLPYIQEVFEDSEPQEDENGTYYEVNNMSLVCSYFDISMGDVHGTVSRRPRIGLTLIPHGEHGEELDSDEGGDIIVYPENIRHIEFAHPSPNAIEQRLRYYFPDFYDTLTRLVPADHTLDKKVVSGLKQLYIYADPKVYHDYPLAKELGLYLSARIDIDSEPYRVVVDGPVRGLSDHAEAPELTHDLDTKITGYICGIIMECEDDPDTASLYRPSLIMAIPFPDVQSGFYGCIVPAESVVSVRSLRKRQMYFGKQALMNFEYPDDITAYMATPRDNPTKELDKMEADGATFEAIVTAEYGNDLPTIPVISIDKDIARAVQDFADHVESSEMLDLDAALTDLDYALIAKQMEKTIESFGSLEMGDVIATRSDAVVLEPREMGGTNIIMLSEGEFVQGIFSGLVVSYMPDVSYLGSSIDQSEDMITSSTTGLGLRLTGCCVRDIAGNIDENPFESEEVVVLLPHHAIPNFIKLTDLTHDT